MKQGIVLALETGIGGGSVSLFRDGQEIDFWKGKMKLSRAEDLLFRIANLLRKNKLRPNEIKTIFVSKGPGSFTGLRIGIATAKGLQKSLSCECFGVYVLEAMRFGFSTKGITAVAVSSGRDKIWQQIFRVGDSFEMFTEGSARNTTVKSLIADIEHLEVSNLLLEQDLFDKARHAIANISTGELKTVKVVEPLSKYIGLQGLHTSIKEEVFPIRY